MKVYPLTNRILPGNDAKSEVINMETRQLFEVANGGIDEANIEEGDNASGGTGIDNNKFADMSWHQFFKGGPDFTSGSDVWSLPSDNQNNNLYRIHQQTHGSLLVQVDPGWVTGQYQVSFSIAMLQGNTNGLIPYTNDVFETANYHRHAIYANGIKVGETDLVCEGPIGTLNIPFQFWHPGGNIDIELYAGTVGADQLDGGEPYRLSIHKAYYWMLLRKR